MNHSKNTWSSFEIYHDLIIDAAKEDVFNAITLPEHLNNWWTLKSKGKPEEGALYNLYFAPEYDWTGKVVKYDFASKFFIKMLESDENWNPTTFGFKLKEKKKGVLIKFWHGDWQDCNHHFRHSSYCWALLLNGLKNYIEKGVIIPFENRN